VEIDAGRWVRLCDELEDLRSRGTALSQRRFELDEKRAGAVRELALVERQRPRSIGERPAPEQTLESAREQIRQANAQHATMLAGVKARAGAHLPSMNRRPAACDFDLQWFQARDAVELVDGELRRLAERQRELNQRRAPLEQLHEQVRSWARQHNVALPGGTLPELRSVSVPVEANRPSILMPNTSTLQRPRTSR